MDKKAEAYKKYNNAAVAQMMIEVLPQIVENVAKPISAIKDVHVYSGGQDTGAGVAAMSGGVNRNINLNDEARDAVDNMTGKGTNKK